MCVCVSLVVFYSLTALLLQKRKNRCMLKCLLPFLRSLADHNRKVGQMSRFKSIKDTVAVGGSTSFMMQLRDVTVDV